MKFNKKVEPKLFIIDFGTFPYEILVGVNKTPEQFAARLKRYGKPLSEDMVEHLKGKRENSAHFLWNPVYNTAGIFIKGNNYGHVIDLFTHELIHATYHMFGAAGIRICMKNEEVFAYCSQHLMRQFLIKIA